MDYAMTEKRFRKTDENGFTLIEVVVAMAIGLFLTAMMYKIVTSNNKAVALQMRKAEIQQNLRASMFVVEREIKRIGFNPMNLQSVHAPGITHADKARLSYQADLNGNGRSFSVDGDFNAVVAYADGHITPATDLEEMATIDLGSKDSDNDGIADASTASLILERVSENGNPYPTVIANHIEALNFVYLNKEGEVVNLAPGTSSGMIYPIADAQLPDIKKIQVSIVVRSSTERSDYVNSHNYVNAQGQVILPAKNDGFDRTLLTKTIDCRNLGLL